MAINILPSPKTLKPNVFNIPIFVLCRSSSGSMLETWSEIRPALGNSLQTTRLHQVNQAGVKQCLAQFFSCQPPTSRSHELIADRRKKGAFRRRHAACGSINSPGTLSSKSSFIIITGLQEHGNRTFIWHES
jgi:hypothetical protein